jgi:3-hydroxybutyryl-CoA dehydrogenase
MDPQAAIDVNLLGILGAGVMGRGIALLALRAGMDVILIDQDGDALLESAVYLQRYLEKSGHEAAFAQIQFSEIMQDLAECDAVIEAVDEVLDLKIELMFKLSQACKPGCLLLTNTSTLSVTKIAGKAARPERVVGLHFFNPPALMTLVEVVPAAQTDPDAGNNAVALAEKLGKKPVLCKDRPGFIVNRIARLFYGEALRIVGESITDLDSVDRVLKSVGFKMGPFELMDLIGLDVNLAATESMYKQSFHEPRYQPHPLQIEKVAMGQLGQKSGQGFYAYPRSSGTEIPAPAPIRSDGGTVLVRGQGSLSTIIERAGMLVRQEAEADDLVLAGFILSVPGHRAWGLSAAGFIDELPAEAPLFVAAEAASVIEIAAQSPQPERIVGIDTLFASETNSMTVVESPFLSSEMRSRAVAVLNALGYRPHWIAPGPALILPRIVCMLINEAAFAVAEGAADAETIDLAMKLGANYPDGPISWGRKLGFDRVLLVLEHLWAEYRETRYRPCRLLRQWALTER